MVVKVRPGRQLEIVDEARRLDLEVQPGGSLRVALAAGGQAAEVALTAEELGYVARFLSGVL